MWSSGQRRRERRASGAHRRVWMRVLFQADAKPLKRAATSLCCIAPSAARFVGVILSLFPRKFALVRCCPPCDEGGCALPVAIIPFSAPASWRRSSSRATSQGRPRPYSPCGVTPHRPGLRWPARSPAAAPPAPLAVAGVTAAAAPEAAPDESRPLTETEILTSSLEQARKAGLVDLAEVLAKRLAKKKKESRIKTQPWASISNRLAR